MAINTKIAKKVLTKKEQKHLTKMGINSLSVFKRTRKKQIEDCEKSLKENIPPGIAEPCWECKQIANKLKIN